MENKFQETVSSEEAERPSECSYYLTDLRVAWQKMGRLINGSRSMGCLMTTRPLEMPHCDE